MLCCRKGSIADSFLRMVTGCAMRYSNRSPSSRPTAAASMELGATVTELQGAGGHRGHRRCRRRGRSLLQPRRLFQRGCRRRPFAPRTRPSALPAAPPCRPAIRRTDASRTSAHRAGSRRKSAGRTPAKAAPSSNPRRWCCPRSPSLPASGLRPLVAENQAVARFPHRRRNHVAGRDVAFFGVGGIDIDAALLLGSRGRERGQVILELLLQFRIGEAHAAWPRPGPPCGTRRYPASD